MKPNRSWVSVLWILFSSKKASILVHPSLKMCMLFGKSEILFLISLFSLYEINAQCYMKLKLNCIVLWKTGLSCKKVYYCNISFIVKVFSVMDVYNFVLYISVTDYVCQQ